MENSMAIRFDKLRFVKKLQEANQPPEIAEVFAEALDDALEQSQSQLATKADLKELRSEIKADLAQLESRLTEKFSAMMYKMIGLMMAGVGFLMTIIKFIN